MNDPHETERDRTRGRQGEEEYGRSTRARGSERREREGAGEQNGSGILNSPYMPKRTH